MFYVIVNIGPWVNAEVMARYELAYRRLKEKQRFTVYCNIPDNKDDPFVLVFQVLVPPEYGVDGYREGARRVTKELLFNLLWPNYTDPLKMGLEPFAHPTFCRRTRLPRETGYLGLRQTEAESLKKQGREEDMFIIQRERVPMGPYTRTNSYVAKGYLPQTLPQNYPLQNRLPEKYRPQNHQPQNNARQEFPRPSYTPQNIIPRSYQPQPYQPQPYQPQPYQPQPYQPQPYQPQPYKPQNYQAKKYQPQNFPQQNLPQQNLPQQNFSPPSYPP
ncbi:hypothetical protein N8T08_004628 [Aspergillus melleus]|uniref:Uncharacterized protein n=1 Tax=Aspergillus melleus TaxID=138277 RepID=A0ACC3B4P4_9EURO|nr:hypothetical protein N8T08_004628 [Aspergillus melleus]